jgi:hypothetical protein
LSTARSARRLTIDALLWSDRMAQLLILLRIEQLLNEIIEPTDSRDPIDRIEPIDRRDATDPMLPTDSTDRSEWLERNEFRERQESTSSV